MAYLKPQAPLMMNGDDYIYPITTADQIILSDGSRLEKNGQVVSQDSEKLGGKAPEYYIQPRNLLDNSDFSVAQAGYGGMHGSNLYVADRWKSEATELNIVKSSDRIEIGVVSGVPVLYQVCTEELAAHLMGKTVTIAVMDGDGNIRTASGVVTSEPFCVSNYSTDFTFGASMFDTSKQLMRIVVNEGYTAVIKWIAVYEGSYTADNLPPYVPKGYAAELAECQRYFVAYDTYGDYGLAFGAGSMFSVNTGRIAVQLPGTMVNTPSVGTTDTVNTIFHSGGSKFDNPTLSVLSQSGSKVILQVGLGAGETVTAYDTFGLGFTSSDSTKKGYIYFSADL